VAITLHSAYQGREVNFALEGLSESIQYNMS